MPPLVGPDFLRDPGRCRESYVLHGDGKEEEEMEMCPPKSVKGKNDLWQNKNHSL